MRLAPHAFWTMSVREWRAAVAHLAPRRAQPLARSELDAMMKEHPDG
jgi:uncharacterized phage protein (TIGR02216 family)